MLLRWLSKKLVLDDEDFLVPVEAEAEEALDESAAVVVEPVS